MLRKTLAAAARPHDDSRASAHDDEVLFTQSAVARYTIAKAEETEHPPPKLEGNGELQVFSGKLVVHGDAANGTWALALTKDMEVRWVHPTQWSGTSLGCILSTPLMSERFMLIFESVEEVTTSPFARKFADALAKSNLYVTSPRPDPPRWAAGLAASMLRGSLRWRENMQTCGARTGKGIEERNASKRSLTQPTQAPKKVNAALKGSVKGVSSATGWFADAIEGVAAAVGGAVIGFRCASVSPDP